MGTFLARYRFTLLATHFSIEQHIEDVYGVLPEGKFELIGEEKEISKSEFECVIDSTKFTNVASTI